MARLWLFLTLWPEPVTSETSQVACFVFGGDGDNFFQIHIFKPTSIKGFLSIYEVLLQLHFQYLEDWRSNVLCFSKNLVNIVISCDQVTVHLLMWFCLCLLTGDSSISFNIKILFQEKGTAIAEVLWEKIHYCSHVAGEGVPCGINSNYCINPWPTYKISAVGLAVD